MVQPWVTPKALARAEPELLHDLLRRCQRVRQELGSWPGAFDFCQKVAPVLFVLGALAVAATAILATRRLERGVFPTLDRLRAWARPLWSAAGPEAIPTWVLVGGVLAILAAVYLVYRAAGK
jgi:hypothetical protein